jgi:glucosamine-6-phosphate deaminase
LSDSRPLIEFRIDSLFVEVYEDRRAMGQGAAHAAATRIKELAALREEVSLLFATGDSQKETLRALVATAELPWEKVAAFQMDEYVGVSDQHPASLRKYLTERLATKVPLKKYWRLEGDHPNPQKVCDDYVAQLREHAPQLCLLGIGENGHLAFNDPAVADFNDPVEAKIVEIDQVSRQQQVNEGWFKSTDEVPRTAITLTLPALMRVPNLILSVPGARKARIVKRTLHDDISTAVPATILRRHPHATLYLDRASAAELNLRL